MLLFRAPGAASRRLAGARGLASACARRSYSPWDFLPRAQPVVARDSCAEPEPLPTPKYLDLHDYCTLEYVDVPPIEEAWRGHEAPVTLVLVHGAPGSYQDFRHLIPLLSRPGVRVLGVNLPGYRDSKVDKQHFIKATSALPAAKLVLDGVRQLCTAQEGSDRIFLVGHSFGAHTAINMAALNAEAPSNDTVKFRGMALLSPAGCRPHRVLRPRESELVVKLLRSGNVVATSVLPHILKAVYTKLLHFSSDAPVDHYVAGLVRAGTTNFDVVRGHVDALRQLRMPSLLAWSQSDEFMQADIPAELSLLCHAGPRLVFEGGGRNIQKTRAEQLATAMHEWIAHVLDEEMGEQEEDVLTQHLP